MKPINLGYEAPDYGPLTASPATKEEETKTHYPSLYLSDCPPELMGLQDGEAVIKFRVVGQTENTSKRNGEEKESCGLELEIMSIAPKVMPKPQEEGESDTEAAFSEYEAGE